MVVPVVRRGVENHEVSVGEHPVVRVVVAGGVVLAVVHAMESWEGAPVLVLEYLGGGTVADRLRHAPLPVVDVLALGTVMGEVLHHVHRAGFLHRDVKPSNIGYTEDGVAKLLDFGLVRLFRSVNNASTVTHGRAPDPRSSAQAGLSSHRSVLPFMGTPAYMSPEAIGTAPIDQQVDLWALAVTLYEALTGLNPFVAPTVEQCVSLILSSPAPDPRHLRPDCPPSLAAFFKTALGADRSRRPLSAVDFTRALRTAG